MSLPASGDQLLVSERFVSLQGEGVSTGAPAAFLRLGNCNLSCSYCDTPYTWDAARFDLQDELRPLAVSEVAQWVMSDAPGRLIITGGEPLLQHKLIAQLLEQVDQQQGDQNVPGAGAVRLFVEIETNGTITPSSALGARVDQWNVSPKLSNSGEPEAQRVKHQPLCDFAQRDNAYFKFVVTSPDDVQEVERLVEQFALVRARVQLMPEASSAAELKERAQKVADWALRARLRYSGRLHLELYGGKRGT